MTVTRYLFNAGPDGADVTTANSGASVVNKGTGNTLKYATATAGSTGTYGAQATATSGNALARCLSDAQSFVQSFSSEMTMPDVQDTTTDVTLHTLLNPAGGVIARVMWYRTGALYIYAQANKLVAAAGILALGGKYRFEEQWVGNSTTAGTLSMQVYALNGTTPLIDFTSNTLNMGTALITGGDWGNTGGVPTTTKTGFANVQMESGRTTAIGKYVVAANNAPVVSAGAAKTTTPSVAVTLTGTATDTDGTIASYVWAFDSIPDGSTAPTLTNANTATVSFTPTVVGVYKLRFTATDNGGATGSGTTTVSVAGTNVTVIDTTSNNGGWAPTPSTSTLTAVLSDSDTSTFAESPTSPGTAATLRMRLAPIQTPATFSLVLGTPTLNGTGTLATSVRLYEGATLRKEWTNVTVNGSDLVLTLSTAEIATVTSWNALDVELSTVAV